jgi:hypothetical protein
MLFENLLHVNNQKGMPAGAGSLAPRSTIKNKWRN